MKEGAPREVEMEVAEVPEVVSLIQKEPEPELVVEQLIKDCSSPEQVRDNRAIFLELEYLLAKGYLREDVLNELANESDELRDLLKGIRDKDTREYEFEKILNLDRFGEVVLTEGGSILYYNDFSHQVSKHLKDRGYVGDDLNEQDCLSFYERNVSENIISSRHHLNNDLEKEFFINGATFGSNEPTYLELLGPLEIIKMRSLENPNSLLLGSYGKYSTQEFRDFNQKISPKIKSHVIDKYRGSLKPIIEEKDKIGFKVGEVLRADALKLPYADSTMDYIYADHLFGFLGRNVDEVEERVPLVFDEAFRVLKPGGSFIFSQRLYGKYKKDQDIDVMVEDLKNLASESGLIFDSQMPSLRHMIRPEVGNVGIDDYGIADYRSSLLVLDPDIFCARFVKP